MTKKSCMIEIRQVDESYLPLYDTIPMLIHIESEYVIKPIESGLGGFSFQFREVAPYTKDLGKYEKACNYKQRFDVSNWAFFIAFDTGKLDDNVHTGSLAVGAITVVGRTPNVDMLDGRSDLAVLWDIRVRKEYQRAGLGAKLFATALQWSREQEYKHLKIECQSNNIAACHFYRKQGAVLGAVNKYAYYTDPAIRHEVQLLWYLEL